MRSTAMHKKFWERVFFLCGEDFGGFHFQSLLYALTFNMSASFKRRGGGNNSVKKKTSSLTLQGDDDGRGSIGAAAASDENFTNGRKAVLPPGTRPYTNGLVVTSFGLREFDALLLSSSSSSSSSSGGGGGGGQALQTVILIEEDRFADDMGRSLCRYWCGEGASQYQYVLCIALSSSSPTSSSTVTGGEADHDDDEAMEEEDGSTVHELQNFLSSLPYNLHYEKYCTTATITALTTTAIGNTKEQHTKMSGGDNSNDDDDDDNDDDDIGHGREIIPSIIEEEEEEEEDDDGDDAIVEKTTTKDDDDDEGLVNAWQYRKSIQNVRRGMSSSSSSSSSSTNTGGSTTSDTSTNARRRKGGRKEGGSGITGHSSEIYCHSYDLSKRMVDQFVVPSSSSSSSSFFTSSSCLNSDNINNGNDGADDDNNNKERLINPIISHTKIVDCSSSTSSSSSSAKNNSRLTRQQRGMILFRNIYINIQQAISTHPNTVIRLFLHRLPVSVGSIALPLLMIKIRKENMPIIILGTVRPWRFLTPITTRTNTNNTDDPPINKLDTLLSLRQSSDLYISCDSFDSLRIPPPRELSALYTGILTVRKCASHTSTVHYTDSVIPSKRPLADRFGVKRDRRKLTLQLLHLPPEDYGKPTTRTMGEKGDGGGSSSGRDNDNNKVGSATNSSSSRVGNTGGCSSLGGTSSSLDF